MNKVIKKLYYGTINADDFINKEDEGYKKLNKNIIQLLDKIKGEVEAETFAKLMELMDLTSESNSLETENAFLYGFKYGALIMMEILSD